MTDSDHLHVRPARRRDDPILRSHWERMMALWGVPAQARGRQVRDYAHWLARERRRRSIHALVAVVGRASVGSAVIWLQERQPRPGFDGGALPRLLYVLSERPAEGIAEALVAHLASWCRDQGHATLLAHQASVDRRLLGRMGFRRTNELWRATPPLRIP